ncbi:MAG TPA: biopolymer transporter ExbD [Gammaproteobacteria bacterium]|nr:biopolymer transporter ExbD [Gammaproteobacteria bacterium]
MNLRPRRRAEPEVNLTSLIDVVFLLLIFFMVSTTFNTLARLQITLPQASEKPTPAPQKVLVVAITAKGRFYVDNRELVNDKPETVKRAIAQALGGRKDLPVIIRADGRTPHQAVVTALDAASQLGLVHISMATTHENDGH